MSDCKWYDTDYCKDRECEGCQFQGRDRTKEDMMVKEEFICYGTFDQKIFECMVKCPYKTKCEEIKLLRQLRKEAEINARNQNIKE